MFESLYDPKSEMLVERNRQYQYGYSYDDFLTVNVAPLHSFMLDLSQLKVAELKFFEDQRFLEDYFLLLQLVTRDNTDWKGLSQDMYIGDYVRFRRQPEYARHCRSAEGRGSPKEPGLSVVRAPDS